MKRVNMDCPKPAFFANIDKTTGPNCWGSPANINCPSFCGFKNATKLISKLFMMKYETNNKCYDPY